MSQPPDHRTAPLALWRIASALIHTLYALFGGPEKLAAKHTLTAAAYKLTLNWLRTAEALMRRLIFIEASAYAAHVPPASSRRPSRRVRQRKLMSFDADTPEQWRVSFRSVPLERRCPRRHCSNAQAIADVGSVDAGGDAGAPRRLRRFHSAWPLAERFEALIRAHNDPAPYAKRLARRLHAAPSLIPRVLRAPDELEHRVDETQHAEIEAWCMRVQPHFAPNTS